MSEKLTKAQRQYLTEVAERLPGTRPHSPPHKRMFAKLEKMGLIEAARTTGLGPWVTAYYVRTNAGQRALEVA